VAHANGVPYIAFRSLSDLAGGGEGENEMGTFLKIAADNSANVLLAFLSAWK
jgi:adenosylhomocysteine nucleosidase